MKRGFVVALVLLAACSKSTEKNEPTVVMESTPTVSVISKSQVFREFTASYDQFFLLLHRNDRNKERAVDVNAELLEIQKEPNENQRWAKLGQLFNNMDQIRLAVERRNRLYTDLTKAFPGLISLNENARSRLIVDGMNSVRAGNRAHSSTRYAVLSCDEYKAVIQDCQNNRDLQAVACGLACPTVFGCIVCGTTVYFIYRNCVGNANTKWPNCVTAS